MQPSNNLLKSFSNSAVTIVKKKGGGMDRPSYFPLLPIPPAGFGGIRRNGGIRVYPWVFGKLGINL